MSEQLIGEGMSQIHIVAIGGSTRPDSSTELALRVAGRAAEQLGARVTYVTGTDLILPMYDMYESDRNPVASAYIESVRSADGLLLASPGYHGGMSGLFKNAIDYLEDLRDDERPYLHGRSVGCIATAYGSQASVATLHQLRQVTHALRGWPTPLGGAINSQIARFDTDGGCSDESTATALEMIGQQVVEFAQKHR